MEGRLGLLEIDISFYLLGIEDIPDAELDAAFIAEYLLGYGAGNLSHGIHNDLAFDALGTVEPGDLGSPAMWKSELIIEVKGKVGRADVDILAVERAFELVVIQVGVKNAGPPFGDGYIGADGYACALPATDIPPADDGGMAFLFEGL